VSYRIFDIGCQLVTDRLSHIKLMPSVGQVLNLEQHKGVQRYCH